MNIQPNLLFDDDDDEILEFINYRRRPYTVRDRINHMIKWDDHDFLIRFRLSKVVVEQVLELITDNISVENQWNCAIAPIDKLLLTLRFYASGSFLITAGDFLGVSKSSACVIVRTVSTAIASLCHQFIRMPTTDEEVPGGHNAEYFRNRKGYFSLNVQTVVSPDLKIMDIVARWPGSCHDQTIFKNSNIYSQLVNGKWGNSLIVADSGYKNSSHIVTPFINPRGNIEELYNESIIRTRNPVERTYGVLKRRFPIVSLGLRLKLTTSQAIIVACSILHNIACDNNDLEAPDLIDVVLPPNEIINVNHEVIDEEGCARQQLIREYFSRL
ncbi:unnamed protein product [Macrosiphum euphorbiae]|uniref:DDE Tnp4 domain-containing protein n=1 Tax=Macrosiphum euphorbiae TaxID=13131 RepID=A0AAV0XXV5_9HEMI|nr:unnamed protein product [Macrosiphum euphorbiae]